MGRFYYWLFGGSLIWFPQVYLHLCIALVDTYAPTYLLTLGKILGLLIFALWFSQLILAGLSILPPGSHCETKLTEAESKGERKRLHCCRCSSKTKYKCDRCSRPGKPVPLCLPKTGRTCWKEAHVVREHDIPSSLSSQKWILNCIWR